MPHQNTKDALTGFNSTSRMEKAQASDTLVSDNQLQTKLYGQSCKVTVTPLVIDCLASIGLYTILATENSKFQSRLEMENFISDIAEGRFSRKAKKDGQQVESAPEIPETIEQLDVSVIAEAMNGKNVQVPMNAEQLCRLGFYDRIPPAAVKTLEAIVQLGLDNAERVKVLFELFSIANANIKEESETHLTFSCVVPATKWPTVFNKIKASSSTGWSVDAGTVGLDESMTNFIFNLVLDKAVNEVAE